jgi:hypothetical protein
MLYLFWCNWIFVVKNNSWQCMTPCGRPILKEWKICRYSTRKFTLPLIQYPVCKNVIRALKKNVGTLIQNTLRHRKLRILHLCVERSTVDHQTKCWKYKNWVIGIGFSWSHWYLINFFVLGFCIWKQHIIEPLRSDLLRLVLRAIHCDRTEQSLFRENASAIKGVIHSWYSVGGQADHLAAFLNKRPRMMDQELKRDLHDTYSLLKVRAISMRWRKHFNCFKIRFIWFRKHWLYWCHNSWKTSNCKHCAHWVDQICQGAT